MWKVRAIRGATTVSENTAEAIREVVTELLDEIETRNQLNPDDIISVVFTTTRDLDAIFPAAIARKRSGWENVPLLDVQQMHVEGSLERCIRVLMHINTLTSQSEISHVYKNKAKILRPDWCKEQKAFQNGSLAQANTSEEWIKSLRDWSQSHRRDIPLLSDEAVSRRGIYEET